MTRVYGSGLSDVGHAKVHITKRSAERIGMGTLVRAVWGSVCDQEIAPLLRECDAVFGCTDDYLGRVTLNRLAVWYYIPVLDMGVVVDSEGGTIREATGRVTILLPGNACLRCRERIPQDKLESQQLQRLDPKRHVALVREGYVRELGQPDPAVVMFTTAIAARAIMVFMQLMTGFMGDDRTATEVLERFHESEVRTNSRPGQEGWYCTSPAQWGRGDEQRFLDLTW